MKIYNFHCNSRLTSPWKVSTKAPAPPDAKFTPNLYSSMPGCRKGGINGRFAYSAIRVLKKERQKKKIISKIRLEDNDNIYLSM